MTSEGKYVRYKSWAPRPRLETADSEAAARHKRGRAGLIRLLAERLVRDALAAREA